MVGPGLKLLMGCVMQSQRDDPVSQHLVGLKVYDIQKLKAKLRPDTAKEILHGAAEIEKPDYHDEYFSSELLELLHDIAQLTRNFGDDCEEICFLIKTDTCNLLDKYRKNMWGSESLQHFALTAVAVAYDGAMRDVECFQHGVQILAQTCQTYLGYENTFKDFEEVVADSWKQLERKAGENLPAKALQYLQLMQKWSIQSFLMLVTAKSKTRRGVWG